MAVTTSFSETRDALHAVAEHVLCAARHARTGRIGLQVVPGGFATPPYDDDGRTLGVEGTDIVLRAGGGEKRAPLTTLRAAADLAGIAPGAPSSVFTPTTPCEPDRPLRVDPDQARLLAAWYALGDAALRSLAGEIADEQPSGVTLWPEHFDVGIRAGTVNYGASPGDEHVAEPYLYVGPDVVPPGDAFWDKPFGATRTWDEVRSVEDALAFFRDARARLVTH